MRRYFFLTCLMIVLASFSLTWAQDASKGSCPDEKTLTPNARTALVQAQKLITEKQAARAEEVLNKFLQNHPDENHAFVTYTLAACYLDMNKEKSALAQYERTIEFCPAYAPAWQNLAKICFDLKKYDRAGTALEKAWELTGRKNHLLRFQAAAAFISGKKQQKALPILTDLCSGKAGVPEEKWVKLLVQTAVEAKQPKTALRTVERLLDGTDPDPYLFRLASVLYLETANYRKAAQNLEAYSLVSTLSRQERKLLADLYVNLGVPSRPLRIMQCLWLQTPVPGSGNGLRPAGLKPAIMSKPLMPLKKDWVPFRNPLASGGLKAGSTMKTKSTARPPKPLPRQAPLITRI